MNKDILDLVRKYWPIQSVYGLNAEFVPGKTVIPYSGPVWDEEEICEAIETLLEGKWLTSGEKVREFERDFSARVGQQHSVMTNSGSSANLLMVAALRSKRLYGFRDIAVVTPVAGFPTTVAPILQNGFRPVFVDVELKTLNLDLDRVEAKLAPDVKAIMFAHVLGNPPDMDRLMDLCRHHDLVFLEDTCDALGSSWAGTPLGGFGTMSTCSFYPAHHITTAEGGMVSTSNPEIEKVVRSLCWWGRDCYCVGKANLLENGTCGQRFHAWLPALADLTFDHKYVFTEIGYNLKPLDLQGAIGVAQLKKMDRIHKLRKANFEVYRKFFVPHQDLFRIAEVSSKADVSWFGFPVTVTTNRFTKDELTRFLESAKIQTRNYFAGNLLFHPAYAHLGNPHDYPNAVTVTKSTFFLGVSPNLTAEQMNYVKSKLTEFIASH
jgi:CDP-6-deoxy-D-xylo-4-hexulose-3-dehydrase